MWPAAVSTHPWGLGSVAYLRTGSVGLQPLQPPTLATRPTRGAGQRPRAQGGCAARRRQRRPGPRQAGGMNPGSPQAQRPKPLPESPTPPPCWGEFQEDRPRPGRWALPGVQSLPRGQLPQLGHPGEGRRVAMDRKSGSQGPEHRRARRSLWAQVHSGPGGHLRSLGGHWPEQSRPPQHPPCPPHGCPPASASSPEACPTRPGSDPPLRGAATSTLIKASVGTGRDRVSTARCRPRPA